MTGRQPLWAGIVLVSALAAWVWVAAIAGGQGAGWPAAHISGLAMALAAVFLLARAAARRSAWAPPAAIAAAAVGVVALRHDAVLDTPISHPLGYANAVAAFFVQGAAAGLVIALVIPNRFARLAGIAIAIGCAVVPWANGSVAGAVLVSLVFASLMGTVRPWVARGMIVFAGLGFAAVLVTTVAIGARDTASTSGNRRVVLWHEAAELAANHPAVGIGPGRFAVESSTARSDRDARWAHHEFLELATETGIPGFGLAIAVMMWGFRILWWAPAAPAAVAAVALAAFGVHACIDYVAHFPVVPLAVAALLGGASAPARERASSVRP